MSNPLISNGGIVLIGGSVGYYTPPPPVVLTPSLLQPVSEGQVATVRFTLSGTRNQNVLVDYDTIDGSAGELIDYTPIAGTATIPANQLTVDINITTLLRAGYQGNRTFSVALSNARQADATPITIIGTSLTITILETEQPGGEPSLPSIAVESGVALEGVAVQLTVRLSGITDENVTFNYATSNSGAIAGTDYTNTSGVGTIIAGQLTTTISVPTADRTGYQASRSFNFTISNAQNVSLEFLVISVPVASGTITDSEAPAGDNAYYDTQIARTEVLGGVGTGLNLGYFSLRDATSINVIRGKDVSVNKTWEFVGGADEYADPQDACKLVMPHSLSTGSQMRVPLNSFNLSDGKIVFIIDNYWGAEFYNNINPDGGLNHKWLNIMNGGANSSGDSIFLEPRMLYRPGNHTFPEMGKRDLRTYSNSRGLDEFGLITNTPYNPTGLGAAPVYTVVNKVGMWYRNIFELRMSEPGTAFTDWNATYNVSGNALGTRNITTSVYQALNQRQTIHLDDIKEASTFSLTFNGQTTVVLTTPEVETNGAANIKTALEALSNIGVGDVDVILHEGVGDLRFDVEFKGAFAGVNQNLMTATKTGMSTLNITQTFGAKSYTVLTLPTADFWRANAKPTQATQVTVAGNSNGALNGARDAFVLDSTHLAIDINAGGGTGGTVSKHYIMFSYWSVGEDGSSTPSDWRIYYRIPITHSGDNRLKSFAFEYNTSDKPSQVAHFRMLVAPTIAGQTVLNLPGHTFVTGGRAIIKGSDVIPDSHYRVTVIDADNISIPVEVTTGSILSTSGTFAGTYGFAYKGNVGYVKNWVGLRNFNLLEADTSVFAKPSGS